jgi:hypothetical protein
VPWIAIEKDHGLVYEGWYRYGHAVLPTPVTAPAAIIAEVDFPPKLPPSYGLEQADMLFREDSFDAMTRVRRGRLYSATQTRPDDWEVYPHPHRPTEVNEAKVRGGTITKRLFAFQQLQVPNRLKEIHDRGGQPLVVIGSDTNFTIWTISSLEGSTGGEFLLTLRGRETFGALPQLKVSAIPSACRQAVVGAVAKLRDEIFRAGAGSVVDRARDAASAALSGYLQDLGAIGPGRELDELIKTLSSLDDPHKRRVAVAAADIVRLFHSREKPSTQERLPVNPVREQEAQLAVYCIGSLLCELGWAEWT